MEMPADLRRMLETNLAQMLADPEHFLTAFQRRQVYDFVSSSPRRSTVIPRPLTRSLIHDDTDWRWRVRLEFATARRMRDLWYALRPHDDTGLRMYRLAMNAAVRGSDYSSIDDDVYVVVMHAENSAYAFRAPYYALMAIIAAITAACRINVWAGGGAEMMPGESDAKLELEQLDGAAIACFAVAGSAWELVTDRDKRREFWTWWLTEAVPEVWQREAWGAPLPPEEDYFGA